MTTHTKAGNRARFRLALISGVGLVIVAIAVVLVGCSGGSTTTTVAPTGGIGTTVPGGTATTGGGGSYGAATVQTAHVNMEGMAFSPQTVTVKVGDTVTWTNKDAAPHNATAVDKSWQTSTFSQGASGSVTFAKAGTFSYICTVHPNMTGTVIVQ